MTTYTYVQLDPRPGKDNPPFDYGVEITVPRLLSGQPNLDHHGEGATSETPSAAIQALTTELPAVGAVLATVRPDADSVTAMAILASRAEGRTINESIVADIDAVDRMGPQAEINNTEDVVAVDMMAKNFRMSLEERVAFVQDVLEGTADDERIDGLVAKRDAEYAAAYEASEFRTEAEGRIAVVESTHRYATEIGYEAATVVVAFNPKMAVMAKGEDGRLKPTGETYRKFTICRYNEYVPMNWEAMLAELDGRETGWGGRDTIVGSPQNTSSGLSIEAVVEIVQKHLQ